MSAFADAIAHPTSVACRRRLADEWQSCGDPRYELIERQLRIFDGRAGGLKKWKVFEEVDALIAQNGRDWAGSLTGVVDSYEFELGLVAQIALKGESFIAHGEELVQSAPVLHLLLDTPIDLERLCAMSALGQISSLIMRGGSWIGDHEAKIIASSPNVRRIRSATLCGGRITEVGLRALAASPNLRELVYADVTGNPCTESAYRGIQATEIAGRYYLVGDAGLPYLQTARAEAARSYDPGSLSWPPSWTRVAWTETERPKG